MEQTKGDYSPHAKLTRPALEYAATIWPPITSQPDFKTLQVCQNNAPRITTGCTSDANTHHLHAETLTLPITEHLKLRASQLRNKSQLPLHPLHILLSKLIQL
jgi:hypothetical protein